MEFPVPSIALLFLSQTQTHFIVKSPRMQEEDQDLGVKVAAAPFDDQNADIILRSSDKVEFRVHSIILSLASQFFKDTFTLPQSRTPQPDANRIDLAEDSIIVDKMLRFCYPGPEPPFSSAKDLSPVIDVLVKYAMDAVLPRARSILAGFFDRDPVRVFAISHRYRWCNMARAAADHTLNQALPFSYVTELDHVPTKEYHLLIDYHSRCSRSLRRYLDNPDGWDETAEWWMKYHCNQHEVSWMGGPRHCVEPPGTGTRTWFREYITQLNAELQLRPSIARLQEFEAMLQRVALDEAFACPNCREVAHDEFRTWAADDLVPTIVKILVNVCDFLLNPFLCFFFFYCRLIFLIYSRSM